MRRLFGSMTVLGFLAMLGAGCGSTGDGSEGNDNLVLRLVGFNSAGIEQQDAVRANSADVDVVPDTCLQQGQMGGQQMITEAPLTQTTVNAVFRNDQALDIKVTSYVIHIDDPHSGVGDLTFAMNGNIVGGRCSNAEDRSCAVDSDCLVGSARGTCNFSETTVTGIVLFDFLAKASVDFGVWGQALPVSITFYGADVVRSWRATSSYSVTFGNFCNCPGDQTCI